MRALLLTLLLTPALAQAADPPKSDADNTAEEQRDEDRDRDEHRNVGHALRKASANVINGIAKALDRAEDVFDETIDWSQTDQDEDAIDRARTTKPIEDED